MTSLTSFHPPLIPDNPNWDFISTHAKDLGLLETERHLERRFLFWDSILITHPTPNGDNWGSGNLPLVLWWMAKNGKSLREQEALCWTLLLTPAQTGGMGTGPLFVIRKEDWTVTSRKDQILRFDILHPALCLAGVITHCCYEEFVISGGVSVESG